MVLRVRLARTTSTFAGWRSFYLNYRSNDLVIPAGFSPATSAFGGLRSRNLNYGSKLEQVNGYAPSSQRWHRRVLLLNHTCNEGFTRGTCESARNRKLNWRRAVIMLHKPVKARSA